MQFFQRFLQTLFKGRLQLNCAIRQRLHVVVLQVHAFQHMGRAQCGENGLERVIYGEQVRGRAAGRQRQDDFALERVLWQQVQKRF